MLMMLVMLWMLPDHGLLPMVANAQSSKVSHLKDVVSKSQDDEHDDMPKWPHLKTKKVLFV
ncbi:unnamed protein product [Musa textilis]